MKNILAWSITDWFSGAADGVAEAVYNAVGTLITNMLVGMISFHSLMAGLLPDIKWPFEQADVARIAGPIAAWNKFVPLVEIMAMGLSLFLFIVIFAVIKLIVKIFIPTIG